jgi:hypothetical protein
MPPGTRRELADDSPRSRIERIKASVRAKVEHPFRYVKRVFGYEKGRYRGLAKNENRLALLLGFANLMRAERYLESACWGQCARTASKGVETDAEGVLMGSQCPDPEPLGPKMQRMLAGRRSSEVP